MDYALPLQTPPALDAVPRWRWVVALVVGTALFLGALVVSEVVPSVILGLELAGATWALVGILRVALGVAAVAVALRIVGLRLRDVGLVPDHWQEDAVVGAGVAVAFAVLQFLVVIPVTGGAGRSDVAANAAQMGDSAWGLFGFVVLAWTGAFAEELFTRGHFFTGVRSVLGRSTGALAAAVAATTVFFAAGHGYQGWAGVVDTGLYGGLTLTMLYVWRGGRLTACFVAHAMWNTLASIALYAWY